VKLGDAEESARDPDTALDFAGFLLTRVGAFFFARPAVFVLFFAAVSILQDEGRYDRRSVEPRRLCPGQARYPEI